MEMQETAMGAPKPVKSLRDAKVWGGLGSIFLLLSLVPNIGPILGIAGLVLVLLAVMRIADFAADPSIRSNMLLGIVLAIGGFVVGFAILFAALWRFAGLGFMSGPDISPIEVPTSDLLAFVGALLIGLVAIWGFYVASAVFIRRSFRSIGGALNIRTFETAALVYLIGAVLTIVLVGFVLVYLAWILFAVAFFSIPEEAPRTVPATA